MVGAKLALPEPCLDPENLLDLAERERVTTAAGVLTIWKTIVDALDKNPGRWKLVPGMRTNREETSIPIDAYRYHMI